MDLMSFASWNIRGVSNTTNRANLKALLNESKVAFLCLQETKCLNWSERIIANLG